MVLPLPLALVEAAVIVEEIMRAAVVVGQMQFPAAAVEEAREQMACSLKETCHHSKRELLCLPEANLKARQERGVPNAPKVSLKLSQYTEQVLYLPEAVGEMVEELAEAESSQ